MRKYVQVSATQVLSRGRFVNYVLEDLIILFLYSTACLDSPPPPLRTSPRFVFFVFCAERDQSQNKVFYARVIEYYRERIFRFF